MTSPITKMKIAIAIETAEGVLIGSASEIAGSFTLEEVKERWFNFYYDPKQEIEVRLEHLSAKEE